MTNFGYKIDCNMRLKLSSKYIYIYIYIYIATYFENLIVGLHVLYAFNR